LSAAFDFDFEFDLGSDGQIQNQGQTRRTRVSVLHNQIQKPRACRPRPHKIAYSVRRVVEGSILVMRSVGKKLAAAAMMAMMIGTIVSVSGS